MGYPTPSSKNKGRSRCGEEAMLEYVAYALLGVVMLICLLYGTMSPEAEERPKKKRPEPRQ